MYSCTFNVVCVSHCMINPNRLGSTLQNRARDYMEWLNKKNYTYGHVTIGSPVINRQCPRDRDYME